MSYLVLARKYRPQDFTTVTGQEHVTRTLANAIKRDKVAHAHLFCGPRGVGKTSIARIFSKALNCAKGPTPAPCLECQNCKEIAAGTSLAVREIDGASHNSVDNVRDLIESFRALPPPGSRYKIYIIDEVHMLSVAAFNALLKSLEEPPPNTVFVLATTEVHKIPNTVISRCVRHDLRALGPTEIESRLGQVVAAEKLDVEPEVLRMITRISDGSMRDSQSLLDRVQSFCEGKITAAEASRILGTVERALLADLASSILSREPAKAMQLVAEVFTRGVDPTIFLREFVTFWRELLIGKIGGASALAQLGLGSLEQKEILALAEKVSPQDLQDLAHVAREGADAALRSAYTKYALEALTVRMASREPVIELARIVEQLSAGGAASRQPQPARTFEPMSAPQSRQQAAPQPASPQGKTVQPAASVQAPASPPSSTPAPSPAVSAGKNLDWAAFVSSGAVGGAKMLGEHLRRLAIVKFEAGVLQARGPKFTISSLESKDNAEKLSKALAAFSGVQKWSVKFEGSDQQTEAGSIVHSEREKSAQKRKQTEEAMQNHPKIKSLQRVFPGSSIEDIKVKE